MATLPCVPLQNWRHRNQCHQTATTRKKPVKNLAFLTVDTFWDFWDKWLMKITEVTSQLI